MSIDRAQVVGFVIAIGIGLVFGFVLFSANTDDSVGEKEPLYWVAPMDSNYRRDEPGKSPMGMDLVPVYEKSSGRMEEKGIVEVSPRVENSFGVRVVSVKEDVLRSEIRTVGYVKYDENQLKHIHPRVEGWVEKLYVKVAGDPVKEDEPLYDLYSPQLVNAQEEFLLALGRKNSKLISAAESRMESLQLSRQFIENLKRNRAVQQTVTFNAPQDGVIDNLNIREGFFVKPGTTLMSIGRLNLVWVEAEIFERQSALVKKGLPVKMTLDYLQGKEWLGEVDYVYPTLDPKTRTLRVRLRFENADRMLKPNMFAEIKIFADSPERFLLVPKEAVIRTGSRNVVVQALGEGRFKSIEVELGASDDEYFAIEDGISLGDQVVVSAQFLLDSESSKSSDFKRMHYEVPHSKGVNSIWLEGEIKSIDQNSRVASIKHPKISEWEWPAMTMDFGFSDDIDIGALESGNRIHMELTRQDNASALVTGIHVRSTKNLVDGGSIGSKEIMDHSLHKMNEESDQANPHTNH